MHSQVPLAFALFKRHEQFGTVLLRAGQVHFVQDYQVEPVLELGVWALYRAFKKSVSWKRCSKTL